MDPMMMRTPKQVQIVLFDGRPQPAPELSALAGFPHVTKASEVFGTRTDRRIDQYRNLVAAWFENSTALPLLLMVDDDAVPVRETAELFEAEGWVLGCDFISRKGVRAHFADGEIGFCMAMFDRRVFTHLPPEPFSLDPGDDCECDAFCRRCREAGMWPRKVGKVGHALTMYVTPDGGAARSSSPMPRNMQPGDPSASSRQSS